MVSLLELLGFGVLSFDGFVKGLGPDWRLRALGLALGDARKFGPTRVLR